MRRYDLDWLRVLVLGLLIFYHVGMFFVPWVFHIKNNMIYDQLRWPMLFLNQWRLPILFVISGMGTYYALSKRTAGQFAKERVKRLLIPLLFGMIIIIPPQIYLQRLAEGLFHGSYFDFWPGEAFKGIYPKGNLSWNHLWFLPYLLLYSLLLIPVFLYLRNKPQGAFFQKLRRLLVHPAPAFIFMLPLFLIELFMEPRFPVTHALIGDWYTLARYLLLFFYGFVLISIGKAFWRLVERRRSVFLVCGILGFALMISSWWVLWDTRALIFIAPLLKAFNIWSWILGIFGYAARYLNQNSRILKYCNTAVYPFYILHQTFTIIIGYFLMNLSWNPWLKAATMIAGTFFACILVYELLIRRAGWLRPLFGLKENKPAEPASGNTLANSRSSVRFSEPLD